LLRAETRKEELQRKLREAELNGSSDLQKLKIEEKEIQQQEEQFRIKEEELKKKERVILNSK
jgi:hypothetical protein